jgi:hypothetical protein
LTFFTELISSLPGRLAVWSHPGLQGFTVVGFLRWSPAG